MPDEQNDERGKCPTEDDDEGRVCSCNSCYSMLKSKFQLDVNALSLYFLTIISLFFMVIHCKMSEFGFYWADIIL
jgi:hypothetical protein